MTTAVTIPTLSTRPEANEFSRGKSATMADHLKAVSAFRSAMASQGHLSIPGAAIEAELFGELDAKMKLSDLNAKITAGTIERNEAIQRATQSLAAEVYKQAWFDRRDAALVAFDNWLADLKGQQELNAETVAREAITIDAMRTTLLEAKTAIEIEMEGIRKSIAEAGNGALPYEASLAQAKLATAQERLKIIPVLQQLIAKETEVLAAKSALYPLYDDLNDAISATLGVRLNTLMPKLEQVAAAMLAQAGDRQTLAGLAKQRATAEGTAIAAGVTTDAAQLAAVTTQVENLVYRDATLRTKRTAVENALVAVAVKRRDNLIPKLAELSAALTALATAKHDTILPARQALEAAITARDTAEAGTTDEQLAVLTARVNESSARYQVAVNETAAMAARLGSEQARTRLAAVVASRQLAGANEQLAAAQQFSAVRALNLSKTNAIVANDAEDWAAALEFLQYDTSLEAATGNAMQAGHGVSVTGNEGGFSVGGSALAEELALDQKRADKDLEVGQDAVDRAFDADAERMDVSGNLYGYGSITAGGHSESYTGSGRDGLTKAIAGAGSKVAGYWRGKGWTDFMALLGGLD